MNHRLPPQVEAFASGRQLLDGAVVRKTATNQPQRSVEGYEGTVDIDLLNIPAPLGGVALVAYAEAQRGDYTSPLMQAKIKADLQLIHALFSPSPHDEITKHIEIFTGIKPEKVPELTIAAHKVQLARLLCKTLDRPPVYNKENIEDYLGTKLLETSEEMVLAIDEARETLATIAEPLIGQIPNIEIHNYEDEHRQETASVYTEGGVIKIDINTHSSRNHTKEKIVALVAHELFGHAVHTERLKEGIQAGTIPPEAGLTSMMSPETTHLEVVAAVAEYFPVIAADTKNRFVRRDAYIQFLRDKLTNAILHNAWIATTQEGRDVEEVITWAIDQLHFEDPKRIDEMIRNNASIPLCQITQPMYYYADSIAAQVMTLPSDRLKEVIKTLYNSSLLPHEIEHLVSQG